MFVAEILKTKGNAVYSITADVTVAQACQALDAKRVGALVVQNGDAVVGVFSERDVVKAVAADGPNALARPVQDYMTDKVIFTQPREIAGEDRRADQRSNGHGLPDKAGGGQEQGAPA